MFKAAILTLTLAASAFALQQSQRGDSVDDLKARVRAREKELVVETPQVTFVSVQRLASANP